MSTVKKLRKRISEIKQEICGIDEFKIGSLSKQWNVCGNPNCKCKDKKDPQKHGPYNKLSFTRKGKSKTEFIKEENMAIVQDQLSNYKEFRRLTEEWIDVCLELDSLEKSRSNIK